MNSYRPDGLRSTALFKQALSRFQPRTLVVHVYLEKYSVTWSMTSHWMP
jgi:hypothetical protein